MTTTQTQNALWLFFWIICLIGSLYGALSGNWVHWFFVCASLCFSYLFFTDKENGESLKQLLARKFNTHKEAK